MVVQDPLVVQDEKARYDGMTMAGVHPGWARNWNKTFGPDSSDADRASGWAAIIEHDQHTDWMWGDMDLWQAKNRYKTLVAFGRNRLARKQNNDAFLAGDTVEIPDTMFWAAAIGKVDPKALPMRGLDDPAFEFTSPEERAANLEVQRLILEAEPGTRYRYVMVGDRRGLEQIRLDKSVAFTTTADM